jgi:hypothetical protein
VTHTKTNDFYIIGSECIHWWNNTELNKRLLNTHEIIKAESEGIEPPLFCSFCQSKRACKMCINKGFINNIFKTWKKYTKDKISNVISIMRSKVKFGKYKGKQYIKLCRDSSYVKYIMDSNFEYKIKKILSDHHKYKTIINKYTFL